MKPVTRIPLALFTDEDLVVELAKRRLELQTDSGLGVRTRIADLEAEIAKRDELRGGVA